MNKIKQSFPSVSFILLGLLLAFFGVTKINPLEAAASEMKDKLAFGKKDSSIEFYFISDWYCKACRKIDPLIQNLYPDLSSQAKVYFIDYAIHKNSVNFVPYNIAFQVNDKPQYFQARQALHELADSNESPTDHDVEAISRKYQLRFQEVPYSQVRNGIAFYDSTIDTLGLNSTPVVVVTNTRNGKLVKLDGLHEITEEKIKEALNTVSK